MQKEAALSVRPSAWYLESDDLNALRREEGLGCQFELLVDQFGDFGCATPDEFAGSVVIVLALHLNLHMEGEKRMANGKW